MFLSPRRRAIRLALSNHRGAAATYDPASSVKQIETASAAIREDFQKRGLPYKVDPEYHSIPEVQKNNRHFADLIDPETGKLVRDLYQDEQEWIINERLCCQWDFNYWSTRYGIILAGDILIPFNPNIAQRFSIDIWAEAERERHSILELNLKARQLGISTLYELGVAHRVQFHPNVNAVVASARPDRSLKMSEMMERCWDHQPWFLIPRRGSWSTGDVPGLMEFADLRSGVSIQHGAQFNGISRGDTPTVFHLSEVAEWINPEELIDAALLNAIHETPWVFGGLESTGAGRHNYLHKKWEFAKSAWGNGMSRLRPKFFPWYVGSDIWPTETWLRMHPIPRTWQPDGITVAHAEKAREYVKNTPLLRKYLGDGWEMPRYQMWFWEATRAAAIAEGTLSKFYQELCAEDMEAFQASGISVFDGDLILRYREAAKDAPQVFGLKGPTGLIHPKHQPDAREIDQSKPPIPINQELTLVPLKVQGYPNISPRNRILIWEFPQNEEQYGLGVDPCNGVGGDNATIELLRKGTVQRNDAQCAEWVNPEINATEMVPWVYALAKLFSVRYHGAERQTKCVIETNANAGHLTQLEMRKLGWSHFHRWMRGYDSKVIDQSRANQMGWMTIGWSRNALIVKLMEFLRAGWINVNSPWFVSEMSDLKADEDTQKIAAQSGAHDDRIMSLGMVLFSLHDLEIHTKAPNIARQRAELSEEAPSPRYIPGWQESGAPPGESPLYQFQDQSLYEPEDLWNVQ